MSDAEVLTEEDRKLLAHLDEQIDEAKAESTDTERLEAIESAVDALREAFFEHRVEYRQFQNVVRNRLAQLENDAKQTTEEDGPPLLNYANIPEEDRSDLLSMSDLIAVTLHQNWQDIAWKLGDDRNRKVGVDTKTKAKAKNQPSLLRYRLKQELGKDLESIQLYRGLKRMAELSGGVEKTDVRTNRTHITGGLYEYREMATADGQAVKRVLWEATE